MAESRLLYRKRWPSPFTLDSITLVRGKQEVEFPLSFVCKPGVRVRIVIDEKGKVTARADE